jgi:hypothetical protein
MLDYSAINLTPLFMSADSLAARKKPNVMALREDIQQEKTPYLNPTSISKGMLKSTLGGITEIKDTTGGTVLFTIDPDTGIVTISGGIVANQIVNVGTLNNSVLTGTITNNGTITIGVGTTGTIWSSAFNNGTLGTPTINSGNYNFGSFGTPTVLEGTLTSSHLIGADIQGGTILGANFTGTPTFTVNSGSTALGASGNLEVQTYGGSAALVIRVGATSYRFAPVATI